MTTIDRRYAVAGGLAMKAPVKAATTANITLSGEQTIDGISIVEDDRVLVKDQSTASQNGIYTASTGNWSRARDFDGSYDIVQGTGVRVAQGTTQAGYIYYVSTADPITIGTTSISFAADPINAAAASATTASSQAANAATSASSAATNATVASSQATNAATSASSAATNATIASSQATNAAASALAASPVLIHTIVQTTATGEIRFSSTALSSGFSNTYDRYILEMTNVQAVSNGVPLLLKIGTSVGTSTAPTFQTSNYVYALQDTVGSTISLSTAAGAIALVRNSTNNGLASSAGFTLDGTVEYCNPEDTTHVKNIRYRCGHLRSDSFTAETFGSGTWISTANWAMTGFSLSLTSGDIASGRFALSGVKKTT